MRLGVDLGGTKIEIIALDDDGQALLRERVATPRGDYDGTVDAIARLVAGAEQRLGGRGSVGIAIPGTETPEALIKNANSVWLNARPFRADLEKGLARPVRLANDANCFALSEASDGAGAGARLVFGVIAGTGLGGGVVYDGKVLPGAHGVGGEWGHTPLPANTVQEVTDAPDCYCGRRGCMETWVCGPALAADFKRVTGRDATADAIAASNGAEERAAMARLTDRMARGLATIVNFLDPDVIVLGGGLSNIASLYDDLPPLVEKYGFTLGSPPRIVKNRHGDSSGVRGAAWLWGKNEA